MPTISTFPAVHRGVFCQFSFWWINYCYSSKPTGKETGKTHICAVVFRQQWNSWIIMARILGSSLLTTFIHEKTNFKFLRCNYKYIDCLILKRIQKQKKKQKTKTSWKFRKSGFFFRKTMWWLNRIETKIYLTTTKKTSN